MGCKEYPLSDVKLPLQIKPWFLNELLDDEGEVLMLHHLLQICGVYELVTLMILIVDLEDGCFVSCTPSNTIVDGHDLSQLVKGLEDMDTNTSVESSWFEEPQVLPIMAALCNLVWCPQGLLLGDLILVELLVDDHKIFINVLVNNLHYALYLLHLLTDVILLVIQYNGKWRYVVDIHLLSFIICFQV